MKILKIQFLAVAVLFIAAIQLTVVSCSDDPGVDSYYTKTEDYAADFLKNDTATYGMYLQILERATGESGKLRLVDLLGTYGSYTVFAPTNDAVEAYLASKGITSVANLSKEDCDTIALSSIIEQAYFTTDVDNDTYDKLNMLDRPLTISSQENEDGSLKMMINKTAVIAHADDSVANGVVHTMSSLIPPNNQMIVDALEADSSISLFCEALRVTGVDGLMTKFKDETYTVGSDSVDWTNDRLCIHTAVEYDNVAYMKTRFFKYTVLVEKNEVYESKGINTLDDLRAYAKSIYDEAYPEDKDVTDETDRRNSLNRFISYHILPFQAGYYGLTCFDYDGSEKDGLVSNFDTKVADVCDWYETLMPYSIMKFSFPTGTQKGLYVNRRGRQSRADYYHVFRRGAKVASVSESEVDQSAINGVYFYIDDIINYGVETQTVVMNERLRLDASTLSPDFITSGARGIRQKNGAGRGQYARSTGSGAAGQKAATNTTTYCYGFKAGSATNIDFTDATHIHIRPRYLTFWSYEGDEMTVKGRFDFTIKLPPVPAGTWEIRFFTCVGFNSRGIMQAYLRSGEDGDFIPQGIPFDMRPNGETLFGYIADNDIGDDEALDAYDKQIHNLGWMKGPLNYGSGNESTGGGGKNNKFRNQNNTIRRVIGTFTTDGKTNQYLRLQQKMDSEENEMNFDFLEICPSSIYDNPEQAEDRY